jgi:mannose-6-phosphate isomerase-like protein (cupin superfamily)
MKRTTFLKTCLAVGTLLSATFTVFGKLTNRIGKGIKVDAGKDRFDKPITLFGKDTFYTKVSTKDTDGDLWVYESTRFEEGGPKLHIHYDQDEIWYILKGEFLFKVGEDKFIAKTGDTVFGPRQVPHAFAKIGAGEARLLMMFQPAGKMEEFFQKISAGVTTNFTTEEQLNFEEEHRVKVVGEALRQDSSKR